MPNSELLDLALRLWPQVRDHGTVSDPADLDRLLDAQALPGAPGVEGGLMHTFACWPPSEAASCVLPTGERVADDATARLVAHILVTRTLVGIGLAVDDRVAGAIADAHALTWATLPVAPAEAGASRAPVSLAASLWLVALDPLSDSDRPLPIDWTLPLFADATRWEQGAQLLSHYDVREAALDWAVYASYDGTRHAGVSRWTMLEPLLRLDRDDRGRLALAQLEAAEDAPGERAPALALLERNRIAELMRGWLARTS